MADAFNPYVAPHTPSDGNDAREGSDGEGGWRDGNLLVMRRLARLPNVCVKTGKTSNIRGLTRTFYWIPDWVWMTLLGSPSLIAVFALVFGRRQPLDIPLNAEEHSKRRFRTYVGFFLVFVGPAILALYANLGGAFDLSDTTFTMLVLCLLVSLAGTILAAISETIVSPNRIDHEFIWLKGVHHNFLESLPAFPDALTNRRFAMGDLFNRRSNRKLE